MASIRRLWLAAAAVSLLAPLPVIPAEAGSSVTIYRCTDASGHLTLRDTPCRKGEKQEAREMVRPKDAPLRPAPARTEKATAHEREPAPRYVYVTPPQPLYECIDEDGERYTSETSQGRMRWEPLWTLGYMIFPHPAQLSGGLSANIGFKGSKVGGNVRIGDPRPPPNRHPAIVPAYPTGQWVWDECHPLPQSEICDRLRDDRYELNRRWNIAQPSERAEIDRETRGIDARLNSDCGGV